MRLSIWFASVGGASAVVTFCKCDAGSVSVLFAFSVGSVCMLYNIFCSFFLKINKNLLFLLSRRMGSKLFESYMCVLYDFMI